jgi:hypothetical protein
VDAVACHTLEDAAGYIMKLPKAERDLPEWQAAGEALMMAAERRGPLNETNPLPSLRL